MRSLALVCLLPDGGHIISLLRIGKIFQSRGVNVHFFGNSEVNGICNDWGIPTTTIEVERPLNHKEKLLRLSRANRFWQTVVMTTWFHVNYFEEMIFNTVLAQNQLLDKLKDFSPDAIMCDPHLFMPTYDYYAHALNVPLILNNATGSYANFQKADHPSNLFLPGPLHFSIPILKSLARKIYSAYTFTFNRSKHIQEKRIRAFVSEYWDPSRVKVPNKLHISAGIGIIERSKLADQLNCPDDITQFGPISYSSKNSISHELKLWLELEDTPVIYVSLGTMVKGNYAFFKKLLDAATLKQYRVLWAAPEKPWSDTLNRPEYRWERWVPQIDILMHPNIRIFVSHGGAGSIQESLCIGKPVIAIPFLWDHFFHSWVIQKLFGIYPISKHRCSKEDFLKRIDQAEQEKESFEDLSTYLKSVDSSEEIFNTVSKFILYSSNRNTVGNLSSYSAQTN